MHCVKLTFLLWVGNISISICQLLMSLGKLQRIINAYWQKSASASCILDRYSTSTYGEFAVGHFFSSVYGKKKPQTHWKWQVWFICIYSFEEWHKGVWLSVFRRSLFLGQCVYYIVNSAINKQQQKQQQRNPLS